jgi:hypothetical protein
MRNDTGEAPDLNRSKLMRTMRHYKIFVIIVVILAETFAVSYLGFAYQLNHPGIKTLAETLREHNIDLSEASLVKA